MSSFEKSTSALSFRTEELELRPEHRLGYNHSAAGGGAVAQAKGLEDPTIYNTFYENNPR
jgi:hypothetical protein